MHPQLEQLRQEFASATSRLHELAALGSEEDWHRRPDGGGWSAAESVAHLNLTAQAYLPGLDEGIQEARSAGGGQPKRMRKDFFGWMIWKSSAPAGRFKTKTTPSFVPTGEESREALIAEFDRLQQEVLERLSLADGLPVHRAKIKSVFDSRVSYSVFSVLSILAVHEHRHLGQAERALQAALAGSTA